MGPNILSKLNSLLGEGVVRQASTALGESEPVFGRTLRAGIPALLAGTMKQAVTPGGAAELLKTITGSGVDEGIQDRLGQLSSSPDSLKQILTAGESLLPSLFGNRTRDVTTAISRVTGAKSTLTTKALAMAAPALFGVLKKQVSRGGLNAEGLASWLGEQKDSVLNAGIDDRITAAMGVGDLRDVLGALPGGTDRAERLSSHAQRAELSTPRARVQERPEKKRNWLPWAAAAAVVAIAIGIVANMGDDGEEVRVAEGTDRAALTGPAEDAALPANVYFDADEIRMDNAARETISTVADAARESGQPLAVTGFAGSDADRQRVARRAEMVVEALVSAGVAEEDIVVMPSEVDRRARDPETDRIQIALLR